MDVTPPAAGIDKTCPCPEAGGNSNSYVRCSMEHGACTCMTEEAKTGAWAEASLASMMRVNCREMRCEVATG